ncbi:MAG: bifunctional acetate--CoA ligase family protein/GNAT family N-acetyltransferase [Deferrisomatales bacterium]
MLGVERRVAYSSSLDGFFRPKTVAVVGASNRNPSVGRTLLWNLIQSPFGGTLFPVNPARKSVLGVRAHPTVEAIGEPVDLAIVATRAPLVPDILEQCARAGCRHVIVMSAFREEGAEEREAAKRTLQVAAECGIRLLGPYSLGVMVPRTGLNATVTRGCGRPGRVGFISQSGTMCSAILDWGEQANVGFSVFVSVGNMWDVDWADLIYFLGDDESTRVIVLYMESVGDPKGFLSAAREVADKKPIVIMKGGRTDEARRAATLSAGPAGAASGNDDVFDAALKRSGVLRVRSVQDLFGMAEVLGKQPLPRGRNLAIVTNAGGPAVLAIDALQGESGRLARLAPETVEKLDSLLPAHWSRGNPIAGLGDAVDASYGEIVGLVAEDPGVDGILAILTPKPTVDALSVANHLRASARGLKIPVLASWMGGAAVGAGAEALKASGVPCFPFPDTAARIFSYLWRYRDNLNSLYETPQPVGEWDFQQNAWVREALTEQCARAREENRIILTDLETKRVLKAYGIPVLATFRASTAEEARERAAEIGYPLTVRTLFRLPPTGPLARFETLSAMGSYRGSEGEEGVVAVDEEEVGQAFAAAERHVKERFGAESFGGVALQAVAPPGSYELTLGSDVDPQFGPVLFFGAGGALGDVFRDFAVGLPPLNRNLARKLMAETRIYEAVSAAAESSETLSEALETTLVRFAQLVLDQPEVREFRIDPLVAGPGGVFVAGARAILADGRRQRRVKPAIRPYPSEYARTFATADGQELRFRPIRPEDEPLMVAFHKRLSNQSVYNRYFSYMHVDKRTSHDRLSRVCFADYDRNMIVVAESRQPEPAIVGVGRLIRLRGSNDAEFAVLVEDALQGRGLGKGLLQHLIQVARGESVTRLVGYVLPENTPMIRLCEKLGFRAASVPGEDLVRVELSVDSPPPSNGPASTRPGGDPPAGSL